MKVDIDKIFYNTNLHWLKDNTIYLTVHGSHAYGLNRPDSDIDIRGIAIPPKEYFTGILNHFNQAEFSEPYDCVIFDIRKFVNLALNCNPNVLELLYTDLECHISKQPIFEKLFDIRDAFLSKKARFTFAGYARSQILRIKRHRKWILNPIQRKPERVDFGLPDNRLLPKHKLLEINAQVERKINEWNFDTTGLDNDIKIDVKNSLYDILVDLKINQDEYHMYAARSIGLDDNLIECFKKERAYADAVKDWKAYNKWKKERNKERYELEKKYGFDCYDAETEFLTKDGWKKFDDITKDDLLATVDANQDPSNRVADSKFRKHLGVVYQKYTDKFDSLYTGNMYQLRGYHVSVNVTANHRMLIRKVSRLKNKEDKEFDLELREISNLYNCFDVVKQISPNTKNYSNKNAFNDLPIKPIAYMKIMGWYLSDGCINMCNGQAKAINISQADNGKAKISVGLYRYLRKAEVFRKTEEYENILSIREKSVVNKIFNDCGSVKNKRIPRWVFSLSKQLMEALLDGLMGDGTYSRPDNSMIYCSTLKGLADDVQELALMCGFETSLYGPYLVKYENKKTYVYHVHINKNRNQYKRFVRSAAIKKNFVKDKRVVCFSVPNSTLITRYDGHIGIHGNCKHGMHLVRLYKQCIEILSGQGLIVKRPDANELLEIRNGAWTYDKLLDWADKQDGILNDLYKSSSLKNEPDRKKINNVLMEVVESFIF